MTQSHTYLANYLSDLVTAKGGRYIFGRLVLGVLTSVLLFPYGLIVVASICAIILQIPENVMSLRPPSSPDRAALRSLGALTLLAVGLPSAIGMLPSLLDMSTRQSLAQSAISLTELSIFETSLPEWLFFFGPEVSRKGPQYVLASVGMGICLPVLYVWYFPVLQRYSLLRPSSLNQNPSRIRELMALVWCAALTWGPAYIFYKLPPDQSSSLGFLDPGTQLAYFRLPVTIIGVSVSLVGALALGALVFAAKARIFDIKKSRGTKNAKLDR